MIFSAEKWCNGREFQRVIKSSSAVDFNSFEPILREAFDLFIRPVLGEAMSEKLIAIYNEPGDGTQRAINDHIIYLAQRANANLAVWYNFYELTVILSGSGIQKAETGEYKGLYKYQERQLRDNYKAKGFNALDDLLMFLETQDIEEFQSSPAWLERKTALVPGADIVQKFLPIERSRLVFLRLKPHIAFIEQTRLPNMIGEELFAKLRKMIDENSVNDIPFQILLSHMRPIIILLAAARMVRQSGTLTDKGLYFSSVMAASGNDETSIIASREIAEEQAKQYEADADELLAFAERFIQQQFPEYYKGKQNDAFNVDNDGRKIFWGV